MDMPADRMRKILFTFLIVMQFFSGVCKQSSTAPEMEIPQQEDISVSCSPGSGSNGTVFTVSVSLNNTWQEIKVFGMEMTFDSAIFAFREAQKGSLTGNWADVDANEISNGKLRIGGFAGSGSPLPAGSSGVIAEIRFEVKDADAGETSRICIDNFTDDISVLTPAPACTDFELN